MSHSYSKIWIHAVWATKYREPLIHVTIESTIHQFIRGQFIDLGCPVRIINGMPDHIHCLFLLNPNKTIAEVIKQVKGSSSHFINHQNIIHQKFSWQTGYSAFSVSESGKENVYVYIKNQKKRHANMSCLQENERLISLHGLENE